MMSFNELKQMESRFLDDRASRWQPEPPALADALIERYPFLAGYTESEIAHAQNHGENQMGGSGSNGVGRPTMLNDLASGWRRAYGIEMCEDVRTVLLALGGDELLGQYRIRQIKESHGFMSWYWGFGPLDGSMLPFGSVMGPAGRALGLRRKRSCLEDQVYTWLNRVTEFYCQIARYVCIECGSTHGLRRMTGWWMRPICSQEYGWGSALPVAAPKRDEPFCVCRWKNDAGEWVGNSYKDMIVGSNAPIVAELGLCGPLRATEVWERVAA